MHTSPDTRPAVLAGSVAAPEVPAVVAERIGSAMSSARAPGTYRTYASAWRRFEHWCTALGHTALPAHPVTVAAYLVDAADILTPDGTRAYAPATLARWVAAIAHRHRTAGYPPPTADETVRATLSGIRRGYAAAGDRPRTPRAPLLVDDILALVAAARRDADTWSAEVLERRDSALLLLGFAGAFRRSELVSFTCGDGALHRLDGLHLRLRRSKTDQDGTGTVRALPRTDNHLHCPPCAFLRWLQVVAAFDTGGRPAVIRLLRGAEPLEAHLCRGPRPRAASAAPLFRAIRKNGNLSTTALSGAAVHQAIRRRAAAAGYDPDLVARLGGHSLRAGFVTQAFRNGADGHAIMRQTGHRTSGMLEVYAREHAPLVGNAVTTIGL